VGLQVSHTKKKTDEWGEVMIPTSHTRERVREASQQCDGTMDRKMNFLGQLKTLLLVTEESLWTVGSRRTDSLTHSQGEVAREDTVQVFT
jgi:hypothetical protein